MVVDLICGWREQGKVAPVELHRWLVSEFRVGKSTAGWALLPLGLPHSQSGSSRASYPPNSAFPDAKTIDWDIAGNRVTFGKA
jgi:hypothetical protein